MNKKLFGFIFAFALILLPATVPLMAAGIVPNCNTGTINKTTGNYDNTCDFNSLILLINNVIKFLLMDIAAPFIAIIIIYTGYLYMTAGGNAGQTEKAKHILRNVVIGYIIALGAWIIINTIITSLGLDSSINTFIK